MMAFTVNLSYGEPTSRQGLRTFYGQGSTLVSSQVRWEFATRAGLMTTTRVGLMTTTRVGLVTATKARVSDHVKSGVKVPR